MPRGEHASRSAMDAKNCLQFYRETVGEILGMRRNLRFDQLPFQEQHVFSKQRLDTDLECLLSDIDALIVSLNINGSLSNPYYQGPYDRTQNRANLSLQLYRTHADRVSELVARSKELILNCTGKTCDYRSASRPVQLVLTMMKQW